MKILDKIGSPVDLKKLNLKQLNTLCAEIREFLVENVLKSGGHLASNLGVTELTVSILKAFNLPKDKVIYDVGHQSYVHKMLTGRLVEFKNLRKYGGLSGFPKTGESPYDSFNTGHASTSVSAALGMARARDLNNEDYHVVAVIGDGAMGGGMAFEGLNDAGSANTKLIVILNDNEMSIEKNVGGLSAYLNKIRTAPKYNKTKDTVQEFLQKFGSVGSAVEKGLKSIKDGIKYAYTSGALFEFLGFTYIGICDGHDIQLLCEVFNRAKNIDGPVLIHVLTKKGHGFCDAETNPEKFHGVSRATMTIKKEDINYSNAFGHLLCEYATNNQNVVAVTAAMPSGCGLIEFSNKFGNRIFDVGIAEEHAVTMSAGLAISGVVPVVCIYSTFLQRAYDQILHDVCLQNLHVVFAIDRAGIVGEDGETHQGVFDFSFLLHIPNITVMAPSCYEELKAMLKYAIEDCKGPVAIRYPRGQAVFRDCDEFKVSTAEKLMSGNDITIVASGNMVDRCVKVGNILKENGIGADVINLRTIKPYDKDMVFSSLDKTRFLVTVEDNMKVGGMGALIHCDYEKPVNALHFGFDDFITHGKPEILYEKNGMSENQIAETIIKEWRQFAEQA